MRVRNTLAALAASILLAGHAIAGCVLRQSDAVELPIGQFVDATDGVTAETGLTISQADVQLKKCAAGGDCGAMAQKNDTSSCAHDALGVYECDFNTTDTDTVGLLFIYVNESGALTERLVCEVLEEAVFDADHAASATGRRDANVMQFGGSNGTFASGRPEVNTTHWTGSSLTTGTGPLPGLGIIDRGDLQADSTTTNQLRSAAAFADDELIGATNLLYSATTGAGQRCVFSDYVSATDTGTCATTLVTDPTGTVRYELYGTGAGSAGADVNVVTIEGTDATNVLGTAQTGDAFARLGAPAGASHAADILAIDNFVDDLETRLGTPSNLGGGATVAGNLSDIEAQTDDIGAAGAGLTAADDSVMTRLGAPAGASVSADIAAVKTETASILDDTGTSGVQLPAGEVNSTTVATDAFDADALSADAGTEIATAVAGLQGILTGTCDSGSTTTCVDNALTQAATSQLDDRLICFDDSWCALITDFTPGTDTVTTTKTAPSTRASKAYTIFPSTAQ